MSDDYFSDREIGPQPREVQEISPFARGGLVAVIRALVASGALGVEFPEECPDGQGPTGTNEHNLALVLHAEIPDISWPLDENQVPPRAAVLDLLEFCYRNVAEPIQQSFHSFFRHYHLRFDRESGKREFRAKTNRILSRNVIGYELDESGCIQPLAPPIIREELASAMFRTEDRDLDELPEAARTKFLRSDLKVRREALEKLWDAWERLKTLERGDKKASAAKLLEKAASKPTFRARLKREAADLTSIGNSFQIRHSETSQVRLACENQVDYLFHRLFSMILLLLRSRSA